MSPLPPQLAPLLNASTYPHPTHNIHVVETHISWVVLTGPFAYKVKKPVELGFVDYSTLALRHHSCHDELRLNRRLAPEMYLDVVRLVTSVEGTRIETDLLDENHDNAERKTPGAAAGWDESSATVEFAVKMTQFEQSQLLSEQIRNHDVPLKWFEQLGQRLARFHHECEVADPASDFGSGEVFAGEVQETLDVLANASLLSAAVQSQLSELRSWFKGEFPRLEPFFQRRKDDGHIRACHGDLHCGNMVVGDDRIVVFDGIEFNDHFRWIDTLNDLAFAWMDLYDRGATKEASQLFNRYLEASGDYDGLAAWRLFVANRALVRAKVTALRCEQLARDNDDADAVMDAAVQEMTRYVELAHEVVACRPTWMVLTSGISGSGKSHFAQQLSDATGAVRLRSDVERKRTRLTRTEPSGYLGEEDRHRELAETDYSSQATEQVHRRLAELARYVLQSGLPVIVDATFLQRKWRDVVIRVAQKLQIPFLIGQVDVDAETARQRLEHRQAGGDRTSDATAQVIERQLAQDPNWSDVELPHVVRLPNERGTSIDQLVTVMLAREELQ